MGRRAYTPRVSERGALQCACLVRKTFALDETRLPDWSIGVLLLCARTESTNRPHRAA